MITPLSALRAFRQDVAANPEGATDEDGRWLQVVSLLQSATDVHPSDRGPILKVVAELGLPDGWDASGAVLAPPATLSAPLPAPLDTAMRSAMAMEDATRLHLAYATHDALLRLTADIADELYRAEVRGTLLCFQGRVARQLGDAGASKDRYQNAEEIGRQIGSGALLARAWVGYGRLAQTRGNAPQAREWFTRVLGQDGAARETRQVAHQSLMVAASGAGDYQTAAEHGWAAYELAVDPGDASAALCDLSELMRVSGHPGLALRGFSAALKQAPDIPRRRFAALGGAALAAAQALAIETARPIVMRYKEEIDDLVASTHLPYAQAGALAELGDAFALLGDGELCADSRARARFIARAHGFYELLFRVTDDAIPVRDRDALPERWSGRQSPSGPSTDTAAPVLDAIAALSAPPEIEAALAG